MGSNNKSLSMRFKLCFILPHLIQSVDIPIGVSNGFIANNKTAASQIHAVQIHRQLGNIRGNLGQCVELIQRQGCAVFHGLGGGSILSPVVLRLFGNAGRSRGRLLGVALCQCCRADRNCHGQR